MNSIRIALIFCRMLVAIIVAASSSQTASAQKIGQLTTQRLVEIADQQISPHFTDIDDFCRRGVVPWALSTKTNVKQFLRLLYRNNWMASMFDDHDMRLASAFSNSAMSLHLSQTFDHYDKNSIRIFFFNINRCWQTKGLDAGMFANLRYVLNHHYPGLDNCFSSDRSARAACTLSSGYSGARVTANEKELSELYNSVTRINRYFDENDEHALWLGEVRRTWLTTSTRQSFKRKNVEFDLPAVDPGFVTAHADKIISHYESLH